MTGRNPAARESRGRAAFLTVVVIAAVAGLAWMLLRTDDATSTDSAPNAAAPADRATSRALVPRRGSRTSKDGRPIVLVMVVAKSGGAPIEGADVRVETDAATNTTASTDADGVAAVALPDGPAARLVVRKAGFKDETRTIARDAEDLCVALAELVRPGAVSVRVTSSSPLPSGVRTSVRSGDVAEASAQQGSTGAFEAVRPGRRTVVASFGAGTGTGWEISREVDVASGRAVDVDLAYDGATRIAGRVVDVRGSPAADVGVFFDSSSAAPVVKRFSWGRTDAAGMFSIEGLSADAGTLRTGDRLASAEELRLARIRVEVRAAVSDVTGLPFLPAEVRDVLPGGPPILVTLHRAARLVGRVTTANAPPGELRTRALVPGPRGPNVKFDEHGAFEVPSPTYGAPLRLWLCVSGFAPASIDAPAVAPDETRDLGEIALSRGFGLEIPVVDADGAPLAFRHVTVLASWPRGTQTATDEDGHVQFEHLPPGRLLLAFAAWRTTPRTILAIDDVASPPSRLVVGTGATVSGRVASNGAGRAGCSVSFQIAALDAVDDDTSSIVATDADGRYSIRLQSGRHRVHVLEAGKRVDIGQVEITVADGESQTLDLRVP